MAKVKLGNVDPKSPPNLRGKFYVRDTRHGVVAQAWPKKRGKAKSGYDLYRQAEFGLAARWASSPEPLGYQTAIEMVKGTEYVPRDLLMKASMGVLFETIEADGITFTPSRYVNPNAQLILDQICEDVGAILYRSSLGWVCLPIGNNGDLLTVVAGLPAWVGEAPPPPLTWETAWEQNLGNDSLNGSDQTIWTFIEASQWLLGGQKTRITLRAASSQDLTIGPVYWGEANTVNPHIGFNGAPMQVLFSGDPIATIPAGQELTSDTVDVALDTTKRYCFSGYRTMTLGGIAWTAGLTDVHAAFKAGNSASEQSPAGYTMSFGQSYALAKVEAATP